MKLGEYQEGKLYDAFYHFAKYTLKQKAIAKIKLDYGYYFDEELLDVMKFRGAELAAKAEREKQYILGFGEGVAATITDWDESMLEFNSYIDKINIIRRDPNDWAFVPCDEQFRKLLFDALNNFVERYIDDESEPGMIEINING